MLMEKCHCARVPFDQIVKLATRNQCSYERVAKELNAGETCTACREDMKAYCESAGAGICGNHYGTTKESDIEFNTSTFDKLSANTQSQLQVAL